jgi:aryl-alcohol dehydrogenase-like predicted oxidoreductase
MWKLAIAWPLTRRFVTSVITGVKSQARLETDLELGDWDMPVDVWNLLENTPGPKKGT